MGNGVLLHFFLDEFLLTELCFGLKSLTVILDHFYDSFSVESLVLQILYFFPSHFLGVITVNEISIVFF
jgi:hypothetical protein